MVKSQKAAGIDTDLNVYSMRDLSMGTKEKAIYDVCKIHLFNKCRLDMKHDTEQDKSDVGADYDEGMDPAMDRRLTQGIPGADFDSNITQPRNRALEINMRTSSVKEKPSTLAPLDIE